MTFAEECNNIFDAATVEYHRHDNIDATADNPYGEGSIEHELFVKNWIDAVQWHMEDIIRDLEVVTPSSHTPVRRLSGGNVQKVLVGREIAAAPTVLMAAYPVRGLDINSSYTIYRLLNEQKKRGVAVIYVGEDLDVLIELCDRIMVICAGQVTGIVDGKTAKKEEIGLLMTSLADEHRHNSADAGKEKEEN